MYSLGGTSFSKSDASDARHVVNHLLQRAQEVEQIVTPLQMIKLVYFCHGWQLGINHEPLIRQDVEAWRYGPVIRDVYRSLKKYRGKPITSPIQVLPPWQRPNFSETQCNVMNEVFAKYRQFSGLQLSTFTHYEGTPWHTIWTGPGKVLWEKTGENPVIPDKVIEDYFANWHQQHASRA